MLEELTEDADVPILKHLTDVKVELTSKPNMVSKNCVVCILVFQFVDCRFCVIFRGSSFIFISRQMSISRTPS